MILKLLLELVLGILTFLFSALELPSLPDEFMAYYEIVIEVLSSAFSFVWLIVPNGLVWALLPVVVVLANFDLMYSILMWILKKIPFLNFS